MRGFGAGLILGFAVGVAFALAFLIGDGGRETPPSRPDDPGPGTAAGSAGAALPVVEPSEAAPPKPATSVAAGHPADKRPKEKLLADISSISRIPVGKLTREQAARAGRPAAALARIPGLVPADLVTQLLAHENPELRKAGIHIAWRVQPGLIAELTCISFSDEDHHIRCQALHMLAVCGERRVDVLDSLFRAARHESALLRNAAILALGQRARGGVTPVIDYLFKRVGSKDPGDRMVAIEALAPLAGMRPELTRIILAAVRDENTDIRAMAIRQLAHLGDAGAAVALELLESGDYHPDQIHGLAETVAKAGRAGEALPAKAGPEVTTAVIGALYEAYDDDRPELLAPLKGRFREFHRRYRRSGDLDYEPLVGLAIAAKEHGFLRELAIGREEPEAARLAVLDAYLDEEETLGQALSIAETILGRGTERAVFRTRLVERINPPDFDGYPALTRRAIDLMRGLAKAEPSPWVRAAARKHVPDEEDQPR